MSIYQSGSSVCQIRNDSIIVYANNEGEINSSNSFRLDSSGYTTEDEFNNQPEPLSNNTYTGTQTYGTKKRQRIATDLLMQLTESKKVYNPILGYQVDHRISMITLTLSDNTRFISARECRRKCLKPFLSWLTVTKGAKFYIWKAERQKDRDFQGKLKLSKGQLHYHIITELFVDWTEVKKKWNYLQEKAGYLINFKEVYNHINPNSTDIHEMQNINDLGAYLLKYVCKEPEQRDDESAEEFKDRVSVDGKIWDCSSNLRGRQFFKTNFTRQHQINLDYLVREKIVRKFDSDFCTMYFFNRKKPWCILDLNEKVKYSQYRKDIINGVSKKDALLDGSSCELGTRLYDIMALNKPIIKPVLKNKVKRLRRRFDKKLLQTSIQSNTFVEWH